MIISAVREIDCAVSLVMDDPELVSSLASIGVQVVYRQHDDQRLDIDPAAFVAERKKNAPQAAYLHLTNEVVSSPQLHAWTRKALEAATALGVKAVAYSYGTNAGRWQFDDAYDNLLYMKAHGHSLGVHLYPDGKPDHEATLREFLALKHALGLTVICTEFGYLRDFTNGTEGWRGIWNAEQRAAFLEKWAPFFYAEQIPVCQFSYDPWDQPTVEKAKSDGLGFWDYPDVLDKMAALNVRYPYKGVSMPVSPPPELGTPFPTRIAYPAGLNLRAAPTTRADILRTIPKGEAVTVYLAPRTTADGYTFVFLKDAQGKVGYGALTVYGVFGFDPSVPADVTPTPELRLKTPVGCAHIISSKFGVPRDYSNPPDGIAESIHEGLDITRAHADCTPLIRAAAAGVVEDVSAVGDYGNHVKVKTVVGADTFVLWYCHMERVFVVAGQSVQAGEGIGIMGSTGRSSGIHLHLNVQRIGAPTPKGSPVASVIDPEKLIDW